MKTERLLLRPWKKDDFPPFAELTADPRVMEYYLSVMTREESDQAAMKYKTKLEEKGWGLWAVELLSCNKFIGYIGLDEINDPSYPFSPAVEIGWRLAFDYWGQGYATEGALASLRYGFEELKLKEIVSFTTVENARSRRVMEKIGMHRNPKDDFDHPKLPDGHHHQRHVLYRIGNHEKN
jgi:3-dehydroquinate dehydratase/shikimate dehydrogenase